jgi:hypothetical protein
MSNQKCAWSDFKAFKDAHARLDPPFGMQGSHALLDPPSDAGLDGLLALHYSQGIYSPCITRRTLCLLHLTLGGPDGQHLLGC